MRLNQIAFMNSIWVACVIVVMLCLGTRADSVSPRFNCTSNNDCVAMKSFCSKTTCLSKFGSCVRKPELCNHIYDPVCGCDGKTYSNSCAAAALGTNVDYKGQCDAAGDCAQNTDCKKTGFFCRKAAMQCDSPVHRKGTCDMTPRFCTKEYNPVCACNGRSYDNKCMAALNGTNVAAMGSCQNSPVPPAPGGCYSDKDCASTMFCLQIEGKCSGEGSCYLPPQICTMEYSPVCGCNGKTYSNPCVARSKRQSIKHRGAC